MTETITITSAEETVTSRRTPWAMLGSNVSGTMTAQEALAKGGLDWDVELRSIFVSLPGDKRKMIKDRKASVRSDNQAVMGIVSDKYVPFQNRDAFAFTDAIAESGRGAYEVVATMRNSKVVILTMEMPNAEFTVGANDLHKPYLIFRTTHDGSGAITAGIATTRIQCTNQVTMAIRGAAHKWSVRHVSNVAEKMLAAQESLQLAAGYVEAFKKTAEEMTKIEVSDDQLIHILEDVLPRRPKTAEAIETIVDFYRNSPTNDYHGSAWGGLNAVTEYFEHGRDTRSPAAVLSQTMDGALATIRNGVAQRLLALN